MMRAAAHIENQIDGHWAMIALGFSPPVLVSAALPVEKLLVILAKHSAAGPTKFLVLHFIRRKVRMQSGVKE